MTPIFKVKTTESYQVSLATIHRQTSYDSDILRQDYGFIRGLPMDHNRLADWVTIWIVNLPKQPKRAALLPHRTRLYRSGIAAIVDSKLKQNHFIRLKCPYL